MTHSEHWLLDAVFEPDDMICRRIMVPRADVEFLNVENSYAHCIDQAKRSRHTRFPLCEDSLDKVVGVIHIKDLLAVIDEDGLDLRTLARSPKSVPENMQISKLLRHFQATLQHMAFVIDEYGTIIRFVTMENVIGQIVGSVQDELDLETPKIVPDGPGQFIVLRSPPGRRWGKDSEHLSRKTTKSTHSTGCSWLVTEKFWKRAIEFCWAEDMPRCWRLATLEPNAFELCWKTVRTWVKNRRRTQQSGDRNHQSGDSLKPFEQTSGTRVR